MHLEMGNIAFVVTTHQMAMWDVVREHFRLIWAVESLVTLIMLDGMLNIINHIIELRNVWYIEETFWGTEIFREHWNKFGEHIRFLKQKRLNRNGMFYSILKIMVILHFVTLQQLELVFG